MHKYYKISYPFKREVFFFTMKKIEQIFFIGILLISLIFVPITAGNIRESKLQESPQIIRVDNEGDGDFTSIQSAINQAKPHDKISVYSGSYIENIQITTHHLSIEGLPYELGTGNDTDMPIITGLQTGDVIGIKTEEISLSGFIIQGSGQNYCDAGIAVYNDHNIVKENGVTASFYGIVLSNCSSNTIQSNYLTANTMDGIFLSNTHQNKIKNNIIRENGFQGMYLQDTTMNTIQENTIYLNNKNGIQLRDNCYHNNIEKNTIHTNGLDGIICVLDDISQNTFKKNTIYSNGWSGISLLFGEKNKILENEIKLNLLNGIHLFNSDQNIISKNTIVENKEKGIFISWDESTGNKIYYNNIINDNAYDEGTNQWDNGGLGGNYWSYYSGSDENNDGFGDTPYFVPGNNNQDDYPIMDQIHPPSTPAKPTGPGIGIVDRTYTYQTKATATNQVQYGWDWNGDFIVDEWTQFYESNQPCHVEHIYDENGSYKIRVKSMDNYGFQSEWSEPLSTTMPAYTNFFHRFITQHPIIVHMIQFIINITQIFTLT